jgi:hypothetical protein
MKTFLPIFYKTFTLTSLLLFLMGLLIRQVPSWSTIGPLAIFTGGFIIAILLSFSLIIYRKKWGSGAFNILIAYVCITPIPFIIRFIFRSIFFRLTYLILVFLGIIALLMIIVTIVQHNHNKKIDQALNDTLSKRS